MHKLENMIDIRHKKCIHEGCKIRSSFNFENEKIPKYCFEHKKPNMIDIISRTCIQK